jgi:hypothetical protein
VALGAGDALFGREGALGGLLEGVADADETVEAEAESAGPVVLACAPALDALDVLDGDPGAPKWSARATTPPPSPPATRSEGHRRRRLAKGGGSLGSFSVSVDMDEADTEVGDPNGEGPAPLFETDEGSGEGSFDGAEPTGSSPDSFGGVAPAATTATALLLEGGEVTPLGLEPSRRPSILVTTES